jgi:hypothetical protein
VTRFANGSWSQIEKLNKNINTRFYESHAAISTDGKKLYFTSNREGGLGELDLWISEKDARVTGDPFQPRKCCKHPVQRRDPVYFR